MNKHLLYSAFICVFALNMSHAFAQQTTEQAASSNNSVNTTVSAPITLNQKVGSWELHCIYPNNDQHKQTTISRRCIAQQGIFVTGEDHKQTPVASLLLEKTKDSKNPVKSSDIRLAIITPLGFSLQEPITLAIDKGDQITLPWVTCNSKGCIASQSLNSSFQKSLETNKIAHLIIHRVNKTTVTINFNIDDLHNVFSSMDELINKKVP